MIKPCRLLVPQKQITVALFIVAPDIVYLAVRNMLTEPWIHQSILIVQERVWALEDNSGVLCRLAVGDESKPHLLVHSNRGHFHGRQIQSFVLVSQSIQNVLPIDWRHLLFGLSLQNQVLLASMFWFSILDFKWTFQPTRDFFPCCELGCFGH